MNGGLRIKTAVHVRSVGRKKSTVSMVALANDLGPGMQFKGNSQAMYDEFWSDVVNPYLRADVMAVEGFIQGVLGTPMVITCVLRTPEAQLDYCKKRGWPSRWEHCAGEAVDIRSRDLTGTQIEATEKYVKKALHHICRFKYHEKGTGKHFHLATKGKKYRRQDKICEIVKATPGASIYFTS